MDYLLLLVIIPLLLVCVLICSLSIANSKSLSMMEGERRGPVLQHLSSCMNGLLAIRVHEQDQQVEEEFNRLQVKL